MIVMEKMDVKNKKRPRGGKSPVPFLWVQNFTQDKACGVQALFKVPQASLSQVLCKCFLKIGNYLFFAAHDAVKPCFSGFGFNTEGFFNDRGIIGYDENL